MIRPEVIIKEPIIFGKIAVIRPPTVRDATSNPNFNLFLRMMTISQEEIWDEILKKEGEDILKIGDYIVPTDAPTPLQQLIEFYSQGEEGETLVKEAFIFFTGELIRAAKESNVIVFAEDLIENAKIEDLRILDEKIFFSFQNAVRMACGLSVKEEPPLDENPKIARIKAKARERDRIKAKSSKSGGIHYSTSLLALCSMGIGITPHNIGDLSYGVISPLIKMRQQREKYEADLLSATSGFAKKGSKNKYWMRDLKDE